MDKSKKTILLITLALIIAASVLWAVNYKLHFNGFFWNDSHDYNQIARNIYNGNGFKTSTLRPINFLHFQTLPHPELSRPPLYPYMLAGFFKIFGVNDFAAVLCDGVFYAALAALIFLVAMELSNSYKIALFSAVTVAFSRYFLKMSIMGSSDIVYAACFMAFLLLYLKKRHAIFWHGIIIGILYLFRVNTIFFVIPWLIVEFGLKGLSERWRDLLKFAVGASIVITPYLLRNYIVAGHPLFSLHKYSLLLETRMYPGWTVWTQINDLPATKFLVDHPEEIYNKIISSIPLLCADFFRMFHPVVITVLILAVMLPFRMEAGIGRIKRFILWTFILQTLVLLFGHDARFYMYLFPPAFIVFGVVSRELVRNIKHKESLLKLILVAMAVLVIYPSVSYMRSYTEMNIYPYIGKDLKRLTEPDAVIVSDMAWEITWYADRKAIWLPYSLETMDTISKSIPVDYIFLSVYVVVKPLAVYKDDIWQKAFSSGGAYKLPGFELDKIFYFGNAPIGILYRNERNLKGQEKL